MSFKDFIIESPVGVVGRTGVKDAEEYLNDPEIRKRLKKLVRDAGGKTVIMHILRTMNAIPANEGTVSADIAQAIPANKKIQKKENCQEDSDCDKVNEARPTRISNLVLDIAKDTNFELIDMYGSYSGFSAFFRYKDGNLYRFDIRPAKNEELS